MDEWIMAGYSVNSVGSAVCHVDRRGRKSGGSSLFFRNKNIFPNGINTKNRKGEMKMVNGNAMQEILDSVEVSARLKELQAITERSLDEKLNEMDHEDNKHASTKLIKSMAANRLYVLLNILKTFDKDYHANFIRSNVEDHMEAILRMLKDIG